MKSLATATLYTWLLNSLYAFGAMGVVLTSLAFCQYFLGGRVEIKKELFKGNIAVALVVASLVIGVCFVAGNAHGYTTDYDHHFRKYSHRHFARGVDWHWFKAQGIAESDLNPNAVSPAGARGIMQIMPATWDALMPPDTHIWQFSATMSIAAGIAYDRRMWSMFALSGYQERLSGMFAAYNCGPGNFSRARRKNADSGHDDTWAAISGKLPAITGRHATETINYVRKIQTIYAHLLADR